MNSGRILVSKNRPPSVSPPFKAGATGGVGARSPVRPDDAKQPRPRLAKNTVKNPLHRMESPRWIINKLQQVYSASAGRSSNGSRWPWRQVDLFQSTKFGAHQEVITEL